MPRRMRAVERGCVAGLAGAHPSLQDRILLNYTRIENARKVRKKTFMFLLCTEVQLTFSFSGETPKTPSTATCQHSTPTTIKIGSILAKKNCVCLVSSEHT